MQNSFHTFLYSVYRKDEAIVHPYNYLPMALSDKLMPVYKPAGTADTSKKNIVLFIMESVPEDFFNESGK